MIYKQLSSKAKETSLLRFCLKYVWEQNATTSYSLSASLKGVMTRKPLWPEEIRPLPAWFTSPSICSKTLLHFLSYTKGIFILNIQILPLTTFLLLYEGFFFTTTTSNHHITSITERVLHLLLHEPLPSTTISHLKNK